ncbi:hypothetical protein [Haloechinothrix salitolerans]|uniref:Mce-associated membrane protein n=1 Tax=Haloechinothrix salitolerans TaxID=926830 RepID=A0ABW2C8Y3_9PSEU
MPIRTHRGRAAVYRRIWGAPLRSPKHLIVAVMILVAIVTGIGFLVPKILPGADQGSISTAASRATQTDAEGSAAATDPTELTETRLTEPPMTRTSAPPDPAAVAIARKWARAWATHPDGISNKKWLRGLAPFTTEEYLPVMKTVEPDNIPATKVTGAPKVVESYTASVVAEVPTNGPTLRITVVKTDAGWRVSNYGKAA